MQLHPRSTDCPTNQQFYVCFSPAFSGCCSSDPCLNSGTCPDSSSSTTTQTPKTISANNNRLTRDPTLWMIPPTSTPTPTPTTAMTSAAAKTGMLVGGIIGGVAIVVAAVGLWYLFWLGRRGRGRGGKKGKESDEVPLKPTHTRSSSAGRGSVYSTAASAYDPVPLGDEGWKSMPSPPPPPLTYTPQRWEGGNGGGRTAAAVCRTSNGDVGTRRAECK
ncbi:hypothetical protein BDD12DRAFT_804101 [Trichophaea hybrida]|nr:hypothetical protein BDD12DRAFT_804101 [Trichophaea hybrida]